MKPEEFKQQWIKRGENLTIFSFSRLSCFKLKPFTINFLSNAGLPTDAAPFLNFRNETNDKFEGIGKLIDKFKFLDKEFAKYIEIGSDGVGNPIVINTAENDRIEWLDHEFNFTPYFFNSSINSLTEFILIYSEFIDEVQSERGIDAFLDADFTDTQIEKLKMRMQEIDKAALELESGFWKVELEVLLANRQEFIENNNKE